MKTAPNIISLFRICLAPIFAIAYLSDEGEVKYWAISVYFVATVSDFLDGYIARKFDASSTLGKILDPLGDKLMTITVMLCIALDALIPPWAVIVAAAKEILMAGAGFLVLKKSDEIPPSNIVGKASTVVFFIVCVALMLFSEIPRRVATFLISMAILLAIFAFMSYLKTLFLIAKANQVPAKQ